MPSNRASSALEEQGEPSSIIMSGSEPAEVFEVLETLLGCLRWPRRGLLKGVGGGWLRGFGLGLGGKPEGMLSSFGSVS